MKQAKNISEKAESKYPEFLRAYIQENLDTFFPLVIKRFYELPKINDNRKDLMQKFELIEKNSKQKIGFGYKIKWKKTVTTREKGEITLPEYVFFQNTENYLKFIKKTSDFEDFKNIYQFLITEIPELQNWILKNPLQVTFLKEKWTDLLKVCKYFLYTHKINISLYIRELPIEIHTKFIENNKPVLSSILNDILPENKINSNFTGTKDNNFEKRFYLNYDKTLIRLRILDKNLYINNLSDISILPDEFFNIKIDCKNVFIVENLMNLLTFPKIEKSIVVWGKGNRVNIMKNANWLNDKNIYYWGDIDTWGLHILSSLREHFNNVKSILMSKIIFERYNNFSVKEKTSNPKIPKNLTEKEKTLFEYLLDLPKEKNRLEQEHILQTEIMELKI